MFRFVALILALCVLLIAPVAAQACNPVQQVVYQQYAVPVVSYAIVQPLQPVAVYYQPAPVLQIQYQQQVQYQQVQQQKVFQQKAARRQQQQIVAPPASINIINNNGRRGLFR